MTKFYEYGDVLHKALSSVIFRVILICYSIFLLLIENNIVQMYYYAGYIVMYMLIYIILLEKKKHKLRTVNDFIFIFVILYMKDISCIHNFALILAPLVNAPNHSGEKRSLLFVYFLTISTFLLLYVTNNMNSMESLHINSSDMIYSLISVSFLVLISYLELSRARIFDNIFAIYKEFDRVMTKKRNRTQIPEMYNLIINKLSKKLDIKIKQITCFEKKRKNYVLKNSSSFVYQYKYNFSELNEEATLKNIPIVINKKDFTSIFTFKIRNLIFVIIADEKMQNKISFINTLYMISITPLLFEKIATIIEFENNLGKEEYRRLDELSKKQHYVLEVMKSTHFLSNKLTPIKNYITVRESMDSSKKLKKEQRESIQKVMVKEKRQAKISLRVISEKMKLLLDKESNPFVVTHVEKMKLKYIYMIMKRLWIEKFNEKDLYIENIEGNLDKKMGLNEDVLEFIFIDIFTNLSKYAEGNPKLKFDLNDKPSILIENRIKNYDEHQVDLDRIVKNYNDDDRMEINKRNNFGLLHIKELSLQLSIDTELILDKQNKLFITKLVFTGELFENTSL